MTSLRRGIGFQSVTDQHPNSYWTLKDKWPSYIQVQRTQASINGTRINFNVQGFDPNMFLKSKAYIKVGVRIQKQEFEVDVKGDEVETIPSSYVAEDRIYKKPGMVLHNSCTNVNLRLNSHTINYKDLRYITKKMNMSFAGKEINNNYLSTSGGAYEEYTGVYDAFGNIDGGASTLLLTSLGFVAGAGNNNIRFISDTNIITGSDARGFDIGPPANQVTFVAATSILTFTLGGGAAIDLPNLNVINPLSEGEIMTFTNIGPGVQFEVVTVLNLVSVLCRSTQGDVGPVDLTVTDTYTTNRETARLQFGNAGGGTVVNLSETQIFKIDDIITLNSGESFRVIGFSGNDELIVGNINEISDLPTQVIDAADSIKRLVTTSFNTDHGRQESYDDAFRDISLIATENIFNFTEPLSFGPFNHLSDYESGEIATNAWNLKQTELIPYIRQIGLEMSFKDIAANALIYSYGRLRNQPADPANTRVCQLRDLVIETAELVLFWVKPRDELLMSMPRKVRIQSWQYDHKQFPLVNQNAPDPPTLADGGSSVNSQTNIYTNQVPTYILYYGMVDKDILTSYICRAVNSDFDGEGTSPTISVDANSVETGMHPLRVENATLTIRSNTLGGDDIIDQNYNIKELYRITLKNSVKDFPYGETKFRGIQAGETLFASYPSEYYLLLGESELNSFNIRKGQLQTSNVMSFNSTLVATDGYSINKVVQGGAFNGGTKQYALHIFYIYDRFFIELSDDGTTDSRFDASFF